MRHATVIGLGEMGSALAGALLRAGFNVTVWNRTADKAQPLVGRGARLAPSVPEALSMSDVCIICVSDYPATEAVLGLPGAGEALAGRTVVQLSTGIPSEARRLKVRVEELGATLVDGKILAWPRQIGNDAMILVAGSAPAVEAAGPALNALAGSLLIMGEEEGLAAALFSSVLAYLAGHWIGFAHGAMIAQAEGLSPEQFGATIASLAPVLAQDAEHMGRVIQTGRYAGPESTLRTAGADIARLARHAQDAGLRPDFPAFAASVFQRAIDEGLGAEEHVAIAKVLRST